MKVIAYIHTHWDREWYQPFQEFRLRLIETVDKVIDDLNSGKLEHFYFDGQIIALKDYLEIFPERRSELGRLISENKLFIGPWYALADEFLVSGESLIRNLLVGINQAKDYGCNQYTGYLPDAFGHIAKMPQIFSSFNLHNSIVWRGVGEQKTAFNWSSDDGSTIVATHLIEGYFQDILSQNTSIRDKAQQLVAMLDKIKPYVVNDCILLPIGADHLATPMDLNSQISQLNELIDHYNIVSTNLFEYLEQVPVEGLNTLVGQLRDNSRNFILPGTFSTRMYLKRENARATWALSKLAEPMQTLCESFGWSYSRRNQLKYAWELLLKNHPHDSICGCSVDSVHDEMMTRYGEVNQIVNGIIGRCFRDIAQNVRSGDVIAYNSSNYPYTGLIKVKTSKPLPDGVDGQCVDQVNEFEQDLLFDIHRVPVQEDITTHFEYLIWVEDLAPNSITIIDESYKLDKKPVGVQVDKRSIKNSKLQVYIEDDGSLSIKDLVRNRSFNRLHLIEDRADIGDTYNFVPIESDKPLRAKLKNTQIIQEGCLQSALRLTYKLDIPVCTDEVKQLRSGSLINHELTVDISLQAESSRLEFNMEWENCSKDHILQLRFKLPEPVTSTVSEDNLGLIKQSFNPDYSLSKSMPAEHGKELKVNTTAMQRFVWAQGLGILTEGLSEYGVDGDELYITLLRSVGILSKGAMATRGLAAGPPMATPGAQCIGSQSARYAICLCDNPQDLFQQADEFMGSVITGVGTALQSGIGSSYLFNIDNENIYTYAVKSPYNPKGSGVIVRLLNLSPMSQTVKVNTGIFSKMTEANSLEECISSPISFDGNIEFSPYEMKTLLFE